VVEESLAEMKKTIEDIKDEAEIMYTLSPDNGMREIPVLGPDGKPKRGMSLHKLGCPLEDCRAKKLGWKNWKTHMRNHYGYDMSRTWNFVELVRREIGFTDPNTKYSEEELNEKRKNFIKDRLEKLSGWEVLDEAEKDNYRKQINTSPPDYFDTVLEEVRIWIEDKKAGANYGVKGSAAIFEIEQALSETGLTAQELKLGNWKEFFKDETQIDSKKTYYLNRIYQTAARKEIKDSLALKGISTKILKIKNDNLEEHFKDFHGKADIESEKTRLLNLINNYNKDKSSEIDQAIIEILNYLDQKGLKTKAEEVLGENWKSNFWGLSEIEKITKKKKQLIDKIDAFNDKTSQNEKHAIEKITVFLNKLGLNEDVLPSNWRNEFKNKNLEEIQNITQNLLGLIEENLNEDEKEELNEQMKNDCKEYVKEKANQSHQKLAVKPTEINQNLFAPYTNLDEKLNSLKSSNEFINFQNELVQEIEKKQEEKLTTLQNEAINEIETLINSSQEITEDDLGELINFRQIIQQSNDPDFIEEKKNEIITQIQALQKKPNDENYEEPDDNNKMLINAVITTATIVLIIALFLIIYQISTNRKVKKKY
jgi:hypothetical protein